MLNTLDCKNSCELRTCPEKTTSLRLNTDARVVAEAAWSGITTALVASRIVKTGQNLRAARVESRGILLAISTLISMTYWLRGWDSNPTRPFRICKLQILLCRRCRKCQRCRRALHRIAPAPS